MRMMVLLALLTLVPAPALLGQTSTSEGMPVEFVLLTRPGFLVGAQVEYADFRHVAPWVSARYGSHSLTCLDRLLGCGSRGFSALAGVRLTPGSWALAEPYLTLGVGQLSWDDATPWRDASEITATAQAGLIWLGFGRIRPRLEVGYEGHVTPWLNVGIGLLP